MDRRHRDPAVPSVSPSGERTCPAVPCQVHCGSWKTAHCSQGDSRQQQNVSHPSRGVRAHVPGCQSDIQPSALLCTLQMGRVLSAYGLWCPNGSCHLGIQCFSQIQQPPLHWVNLRKVGPGLVPGRLLVPDLPCDTLPSTGPEGKRKLSGVVCTADFKLPLANTARFIEQTGSPSSLWSKRGRTLPIINVLLPFSESV